MLTLVDFRLPLEPFNSMVKNGTAAEKVKQVLADIKPKHVWFSERDGKRGGIMIVDLADPSKIPSIAEPLFLAFNAAVHFHPLMTPEELGKSGIDEIGSRYD
jgi:hypothetical protein